MTIPTGTVTHVPSARPCSARKTTGPRQVTRTSGPLPGAPDAGPGHGNLPSGDGTAPASGRAEDAARDTGDGTAARFAEAAATAGGGGGRGTRGTRRGRRFGRRGKIVMWVALSTVAVLVVSGTLVYLKLNANLQSAPLDLGGVRPWRR